MLAIAHLAVDTTTLVSRLTSTPPSRQTRSEEHTSELQSHLNLVCRLLLEKKKENAHVRKRLSIIAIMLISYKRDLQIATDTPRRVAGCKPDYTQRCTSILAHEAVETPSTH